MRALLVLIFLTPLLSGCGLDEREEALKKREAAVALREQDLLEKENALNLQEAALARRQQQLDSTRLDTVNQQNQAILGNWNVTMTCTETTCPGSAVGDTKTENWQFSYEQGFLQAKATVKDKVIRIYTGSARPNKPIELTATIEPTQNQPATKMEVRLSATDSTTLVGHRIITRETGCRIVYDLKLTR